MFTGIIETTGTVIGVEPRGDSAVLRLHAGTAAHQLPTGGSLAVDGVCLTATPTADPEVFVADVMGESLARTTLGSLEPGARVNLERCLPAGGRFDGHIVQGHVDGIGTVLAVTEHPAWTVIRVEIPADLAPLLAQKGSIALAGVSLTVTRTSPAQASEHWFEVGIIPATRRATTLGTVTPGDRLNLETDAVAKYLLRARAFDAEVLGTGESSAWTPPAPDEVTDPAPDTAPRGASTAAEELAPSASQPEPHQPVPADGRDPGLDTVAEAVAAIAAGGLAVVVDDEQRENEGDLIGAAGMLRAEAVGFLIRHSSGVLCAPMTAERADALDLPPMVARNQDPKGTAYTVTCDATEGVSTGIGAADRARTLQVLADPATVPDDLTRPGHVLPLRAHPGGVRSRAGHTEAAVELTRLAGLAPVGCIAEVVHDDGSLMRFPDLRAFATAHGLPMISIEDLAAHLDRLEATPLRGTDPVVVPTEHGPFAMRAWTMPDGAEHLSATAVDAHGAPLRPSPESLVRLHSECLTGDVFASRRCDCGAQLDAALELLAREGGTLVYLRGHEGRGIGLANKLRAYALQEEGLDTVDANLALGLPVEARDFSGAAAVLRELGLERIRLVSNNPAKAHALGRHGIRVTGLVPDRIPPVPENARYLDTKRERMGHLLPAPDTTPITEGDLA